MSRLTKNISKKQSYCEFEIKNCKYQDIYDFEKYSELEDYVDCDLTLAVDKLGQLEDILEKFGIDDLETLEEILKVHKFLLDHDYSTMTREDFDLLFDKIKALEIIKNKKVNVRLFIECKTRKEYNDEVRDLYYQRLCLTQEEYDLLKEVLL